MKEKRWDIKCIETYNKVYNNDYETQKQFAKIREKQKRRFKIDNTYLADNWLLL